MASPLEPNAEQRPVLELERGSLLLTGPPGAGKTAILRERVARLIEGGANPERVLLLTLNRRAARDAREHLVHRLARSLPDLSVHTAHGLAYRLIGRRFEHLGYGAPPHLLSAPEQYAVVRQLLDGDRREDWPRLGHLLERPSFARQLADFVLRVQERLLGPDELEALAERSERPEYVEAATFYRRYVDAQLAADRTDFSGLLLQAVTLLERDLGPDDAYDHVLVDDYQDATPATEGMLRAIAPAATSVVVAADPHAHVFSYQGGSLEPLSRLGEVLGGLGEVTLSESPRLGPVVGALRALEDPTAPPSDAAAGVEARVFAHPGEEADAVAHELVRHRVEEGIAWEQMAVIVRRYGEYLTALRQALARHDVPFVVVAEASAVAGEPVNRPIIDVLRYAFRPERRDDLVERLLVTPLFELDPHDVRRLRREARLRDRSLRELVESDGVPVPEDLRDRVERFRSIVEGTVERGARAGPDEVFFWLWSSVPWFRSLAEAGDRPRDLDALAALGDVLTGFVERRPGSTVEDYLETLDAAEFGPDPWIPPEERYPQAVRLISAHRAQGLEFEVAVVAGCLEGEFPSGSHPEPLLDIRALTAPRSPRDRLRERLAEERALFRLAVSRARRRTLLTASSSTSARNPRTPSRFAGRLGLAWGATPSGVEPEASLRTLEASLRRTLADAAASRPARLAALAALPRANGDPRAWSGGREWTDPGTPLHEGEIRTSYSRFSVLENCALQYLYAVEMGLDPERSHHMWLGSVIHDLVDRVQRGDLPRDEGALQRALDEAWRPEVFPNRALERQRYLDATKMLRLWLEDPGYGDVLASEERFAFRLDGAEVHGRIDAVFRVGDRGLRVVDYKTGKSTPTLDEVQRSLQLGAYYLAMRRVPEFQELGEPRILELAYLFHEGGDQGYKHFAINPDRLGDYESWAESSILDLLEVVRAERFAPNPEANCHFCDFKPICPVWPQGAEVTA